jgi:hypothetical protein
MKILSKFKDYYDHLVGYFGRDETRVYDRRIAESLIPKEKRGTGKPIQDYYDGEIVLKFHICGKIKIVLFKDKQFYFSENEIPVKKNIFGYSVFSSNNNKTSLNEKYRQPILLEVGYSGRLYIPSLSEFNFPKYIPAKDMYMQIYDYLGWLKDNPAIPNKQKDIEKVVSHGFDKKRSFRPLMK